MSDIESADALFREASALQQQNRLEAAMAAYARLLKQYPEHTGALNRLGNCLLAINKPRQAALLLARACQTDPNSAVSHFNLGRTLWRLDQRDRARLTLTRALELDDSLALAWMHLGRALEHDGMSDAGLVCYQTAFDRDPRLETLPGKAGVPPELEEFVTQARRALRARLIAVHDELMETLSSQYGADSMARVRECLDIQHGRQAPEYSDPLQRPESIYMPGLQPRPFFERDQFEWIEALEAQFAAIRDEYLALTGGSAEFVPYVSAGPGVPEAMQNLAGSHDWDAFHLYVGGEIKTEHAERCPLTTQLVGDLPLAHISGVAPEAFFSVLRPGAHIKPHFGISNAKLAVHLPLIVPKGCAIRVGDETRSWTEGECLIFDDSYEHEAWNRGDAVRVVLIFEVWHPSLTPAETDSLERLSAAIDAWAATARSDLPAPLR